MNCPTPRSVPDVHSKYKNDWLYVPCRHCPVCDSNKRNEWTIRLTEELKQSFSCWFVTLTYRDEELPRVPNSMVFTLEPKHLQLFNKHLRQKESRYRKKYNVNETNIRFYAVGEYGTQLDRPHYHALYFNLSEPIAQQIKKIWKMGNVEVTPAIPARIGYITKYFINRYQDESLIRQKPFTRMSTRPGIGWSYIKRAKKFHQENQINYMKKDGFKLKMPDYYRTRIFTEQQRAEMLKQAQPDIIKTAKIKFDKHQDIEAYELAERKQKFKSIRKKSKGTL